MTRRLLERRAAWWCTAVSCGTDARRRFAGPRGDPARRVDPLADRTAIGKNGADEITPLVGIFGFLKPYKRIAESLRAFRRLRLAPNAKMIPVGEQHPTFRWNHDPLHGLSSNARGVTTPIDDFVGYLGACDIVLNLRTIHGGRVRARCSARLVWVRRDGFPNGSFQEFPAMRPQGAGGAGRVKT
jgi:hypothetical protein